VIHYGTSSGEYDFSVDVGNHTTCTISGIKPDKAYYFAATAYNEIDESEFSKEIVYTVNSEPDPSTDDPFDEAIIIDNGDESTFDTGRWRKSSGLNPYGDESLYSIDDGSRYTFEAELNGNYLLSLWWTEHSSRCSQVPIEIYDGDALLETVEINQQTSGGQWNELGEYLFNGTASVVVVSQGDCSTGVDALELVPLPSFYQIASSAGSGGKITPSGEVTVSSGSSASYTIKPNANYHILDVKADGISVGQLSSYTFKNVSAEHTITVSFEAAVTSSTPSTRSWSRWWDIWARWF
jgi:hypothetical protein